MRYRDFKLTEDELFELKMSPGRLEKMAGNIEAQVGMEFELIIPNYYDNEDSDYNDSEPDRDADESIDTGPNWRQDFTRFFRGGDNPNGRDQINYVIEALDEEYWSWLSEKWEDAVNDDPDIYSEIYQIMKDDYLTQGDDESDEEFEERAQAIANNGEREWDEAKEYVREQWESEADRFDEFLEDMDYNTYWDIYDAYSGRLDWPYWIYPENESNGVDVDVIASDFGDAIGKPVIASSSYHGATRRPGHYVVEPDGSLSGDDGESGLEFVSPPQPVSEMLSDIDKIVKWAERIGAYTNESTGLHMNVSVPNQQNLDYVKLAMFLGDDYILERFGRDGNTYCKSALKKIKMAAKQDPSRVEEMMRQFQGGLNQLASKIIHTGSTDKYTSINNRKDWIEFRGPGGNWLDGPADIKRVKDTLLRAVVALDIATKPDEYKQEYYKKLYKTLSQGSEDDSIQYFARYAAGELPATALKSFVRQIQQQRKLKKEPNAPLDMPFVWKVTGSQESGYQSRGTEVIATSAEQAKARAVEKWSLNIGQQSIEEFTAGWRAVPIRPASDSEIGTDNDQRGLVAAGPRRTYWVYVEGDYERGLSVQATSEYAARQIASMDRPGIFASVPFADIKVEIMQPTSSRDQEFSGIWEVVSRATDAVVYRFSAEEAHMTDPRSVGEAERVASSWRQRNNFDDAVYVRPMMRSAQSVAGSTQDLTRQRGAETVQRAYPHTPDGNWEVYSVASNNTIYRFTAQDDDNAEHVFSMWNDYVRNPSIPANGFRLRPVEQQRPAQGTGSLPPGNVRWLILDRNDQEVYSFVNRANQGDANQYARQWMTTTAPREVRDRGPFTIVPAR